jgi:hypothetical protein
MPKPPRFVNLQSTPVGVLTPERKKLYVMPFASRDDHKETPNLVFVVEGEHYNQFVAPAGPLAPFPESAASVPDVATPAVAPGSAAGEVPPAGGSNASDAGGDTGAPAGGAPAAAGGAPADAGSDGAGSDAGSPPGPANAGTPPPKGPVKVKPTVRR